MTELKPYEQQAIALNFIITAANQPQDGRDGLLSLVAEFNNEFQVDASPQEERTYGRTIEGAAAVLPKFLKSVRRIAQAAEARLQSEAEALALEADSGA